MMIMMIMIHDDDDDDDDDDRLRGDSGMVLYLWVLRIIQAVFLSLFIYHQNHSTKD